MNLAELRTNLPRLLRFGEIEEHLNIPQYVAVRIIRARKVRTIKTPDGRRGHGSVFIDRDGFLAALESLPDAYQPKPPSPPAPTAVADSPQPPRESLEMPPTGPSEPVSGTVAAGGTP